MKAKCAVMDSVSKRCGDTVRPYVSKAKRSRAGEAKCGDGTSSTSSTELSITWELNALEYFKQVTDEPRGSQEGESRHNFKQSLHAKCLFRQKRHSNAVTHVRWSKKYPGVFASSSLDRSIALWSVRSPQRFIGRLTSQGAMKDCRWSIVDPRLASGGFDKMVTITDVVSGKVVRHHKHTDYVSSILYHPTEAHVIIAGTFKSGIYVWDDRVEKVIKHTSHVHGQVHDLLFLPGSKTFLSSCEVTRKGSMDKAVIAWDFDTMANVSNQIYQDVYSCWDMRLHPDSKTFLVQSSGGYIARFSTCPPHKLDKYKRYEGHTSSSNRSGFDVSRDGSLVASGSEDGSFVLYDYYSSRLLSRQPAHDGQPCTDASFNEVGTPYLATSSWDGEIAVWS